MLISVCYAALASGSKAEAKLAYPLFFDVFWTNIVLIHLQMLTGLSHSEAWRSLCSGSLSCWACDWLSSWVRIQMVRFPVEFYGDLSWFTSQSVGFMWSDLYGIGIYMFLWNYRGNDPQNGRKNMSGLFVKHHGEPPICGLGPGSLLFLARPQIRGLEK